MSGDADRRVVELISIAERLDSLAEIAELMGDAPTDRNYPNNNNNNQDYHLYRNNNNNHQEIMCYV